MWTKLRAVATAAAIVTALDGCVKRDYQPLDAVVPDASDLGADVAPDAAPEAPPPDALPDAMDEGHDAGTPDADALDAFDADAPDDGPAPDGPDADASDAPPCPTGQTRCADGECVDPLFNNDHCGGCDRPACPSGRVCVVGRCVVSTDQLALGNQHSCARISRPGCEGTFCWGQDRRCALGLRGVTPERDGGAADGGPADADAACPPDATVSNFSDCIPFGQQDMAVRIPGFERVVGLAAGAAHTCAVVDDPTQHGTVYCWGHNGYGQVGDSTRQNRPGPTRVVIPERVVQVAASGYRSCALAASGAVYCWGTNNYGELGTDRSCPCAVEESMSTYPYRCQTTPLRVNDLPSASQIALNSNNTCALLRAGTVMCWGYNGEGQLGTGASGGGGAVARAIVRGLTGVVQVGMGNGFGCALTEGGEVFCWGNNTSCGLGVVTPTGSSPAPVQVRGLSGITRIALGFAHACALEGGAGNLWCWGYNAQHQLGVPSSSDTAMLCSGSMPDRSRQTPIRATGVGDAGVARQIAVNGYHSCLLNDRQEVWCWGLSDEGQLGDARVLSPLPDVARPVIGICP